MRKQPKVVESPFSQISPILEIWHIPDKWREVLGYDHRNLVHFDGRKLTYPTLRESYRIMLRMETRYRNNEGIDSSYDLGPRLRWLKLIGEELRGAK